MTTLVEMLIDGTWTQVTGDVYTRDEISITRGKANESGQTAPSSCFLTLNNRDGKYSPRNPLSPYAGKIGRNTQLRVAEQTDPAYDAYSAAQGTGDLSWTHTPVGAPTGVCVFVWQYNTSAGEVASVTYGGVPMERKIFGLFTLGAVNAVGHLYFLNREIPSGPQTVLVDTTTVATRHASATTFTGGSNCEIDASTFGYSNTTPSANPIINITTFKRSIILQTLLSDLDDGSTISPQAGYTGLGEHDLGTETVGVARTAVLGANTYGAGWSAASAHWGIMAVAIRAVSYRFTGEVSSFPGRWDVSGKDAWVPVECAGLLRRIGQGTQPVASGLRQAVLNTTPVSYWPLDDGSTSVSGANVHGTYPHYRFAMSPEVITNGSVTRGDGDLGPTMDPGLKITHTGTTGGYLWAYGLSAPNASALAGEFVYKAEALGEFTYSLRTYSAGRYDQWNLDLNGDSAGKDFFLSVALDIEDTSSSIIGLAGSGAHGAITDGQLHHVRLQIAQSGPDVDYTVYVDGVPVITGTLAAWTTGGSYYVLVRYPPRTGKTAIALGHLAIWESEKIPAIALTSAAAAAFSGEAAGRRFERLCDETNTPFASAGDLDATLSMGQQFSDYFSNQLTEIEATDLGLIFEPRDGVEVGYRTRSSLYSQAAAVTLDLTAGHLAPPFEPVDDDQSTRNDIFAQRREGSSYQATLETGPLSVLAPPNGVGRYKDEVPVNVESDEALPEIAGWLLHLGTVNEARYPTLRVNLAAPDISDALAASLLAVDVGDLVTVTNADTVNIHDDISVIVLGYTETIGPVEHSITFNCAPASPYEVLVLDDGVSRVSSGETSQLPAGISSTATSMEVLSADGVTLWTTDPAQMPTSIMVAGEEMTVTAISGTTPGANQTFTVVRSVNGVVKAQDDGAVVRLKHEAVVAL